jgi:hypothetical protein
MNTIQFGMAILDWLQSDPSHVVVAASAVAAMTPTPVPGTLYAKIYKIVDLFAVNVFRAKDTGVTPAAVAEQVAALLSQFAVKTPVVSIPPAAPAPASAATVVNVTP